VQINSRSVVYLDWDDDGDLDMALNNFQGPATLLRNNTDPAGGNWLKVRLVGDPARGVNRDAIGARLVGTGAGGLHVFREVTGGSGYMASHPKVKHFGLGDAASMDLLVTWPDGKVQRLAGLEAGRTHTIRYPADD